MCVMRAGIRSSLPPPVRVGACRALVRLLPLVQQLASSSGQTAVLAAAMPGLYEGTTQDTHAHSHTFTQFGHRCSC